MINLEKDSFSLQIPIISMETYTMFSLSCCLVFCPTNSPLTIVSHSALAAQHQTAGSKVKHIAEKVRPKQSSKLKGD